MSLLRATFSLCLLLPWTASAAGAEDVRVYRCVASNGAVALQDTPCNSGRQQVRDLQRPRDPAPRVVRSDATPPPPSEPRSSASAKSATSTSSRRSRCTNA